MREKAADYKGLRDELEKWYMSLLDDFEFAATDPTLPSSVYADMDMLDDEFMI